MFFHQPHAEYRDRKDGNHGTRYDPLARDNPGQQPAKTVVMTGVVNRCVSPLYLFDIGQHLHAQIRRKHHRDNPGGNKGDTDDPEHVAGIFAGGGLGKTVRHETNGGDQRTGEHRGGGVAPGIGGGFDAVVALFHFHHHHFDGDDGIIDQQPERQDQRAQGDTVKVFTGSFHHHEDNRQR